MRHPVQRLRRDDRGNAESCFFHEIALQLVFILRIAVNVVEIPDPAVADLCGKLFHIERVAVIHGAVAGFGAFIGIEHAARDVELRSFFFKRHAREQILGAFRRGQRHVLVFFHIDPSEIIHIETVSYRNAARERGTIPCRFLPRPFCRCSPALCTAPRRPHPKSARHAPMR